MDFELTISSFVCLVESNRGGFLKSSDYRVDFCFYFVFLQIIWRVFDKYMDVFVSAQKKNLDNFLEGCITRIRSGAERPVREAAPSAYPLPSSADMFLLSKKIVAESSKLSSNPNALLTLVLMLSFLRMTKTVINAEWVLVGFNVDALLLRGEM